MDACVLCPVSCFDHGAGDRHVTKLETDSKSGDFLAMHVYEGTQGKRVYYPDNPMFRGIYTNNPHTLIRYEWHTVISMPRSPYIDG